MVWFILTDLTEKDDTDPLLVQVPVERVRKKIFPVYHVDVCHSISRSISIPGEGEIYQYRKCFVRLRLDTKQKWKLKQNSANSALFYCQYKLAAKGVSTQMASSVT